VRDDVSIEWSPSSFTNGPLYARIVRRIFNESKSSSSSKNDDRIQLLLHDCWTAHNTAAVRRACRAHRVAVVTVAACLTSHLSPLDQAVFAPFKARYRRREEAYLDAAGYEDRIALPQWRGLVATWAVEAWSDLPTDCVVNGFLRTGMGLPFDGTLDYRMGVTVANRAVTPDDVRAVLAQFQSCNHDSFPASPAKVPTARGGRGRRGRAASDAANAAAAADDASTHDGDDDDTMSLAGGPSTRTRYGRFWPAWYALQNT
jgi:hypothetical protein